MSGSGAMSGTTIRRGSFFCGRRSFNVVPVAPDMIDGEPQLDHRWWSLQEIEAAREVEFAPRRLGTYLEPLVAGHLPKTPIDVGV